MRCMDLIFDSADRIAAPRIHPEVIEPTAVSEYPLAQAPHCCRCDSSSSFENACIADRHFGAEIGPKRVDVRGIVVKREHHDAGSVDFRNGRHE